MKKILPFSLLTLAAVAIAVATAIEHFSGTEKALDTVYHAPWFIVVWGLIIVSATYLIYRNKMWRRPALLLLHISFVVILTGALVTHLTSRSGFIHLRKGDAACTFWVKDKNNPILFNGNPLPFYICLKDFSVELDKNSNTPSDYISTVLLKDKKGEEETTISMNHIGRIHGYRIYQTDFDEDLQGSIFTVNYDPWGTGITYVGYLLLAISMIGCSFKYRSSRESRESSVSIESSFSRNSSFSRESSFSIDSSHSIESRASRLPVSLLAVLGILLASYMVLAIAFQPLMPVLRSPLLFIHVGTIMIAYILLVVSILKRSVLKLAVFFLAAGIFLGAIWANISWGTYWSWDPKESWALVTLVIYSIPLHHQSLPWFRSDRNYRLYLLFGFLCLLMTYFGVNFFLGGMHSYA